VRNTRTRAIVIALAIIVVGYIFGFRFAHPQEGLGTALGSAKTSVVLYRTTNSLAFENKIIFKSNTGNTALGVVAGTNGTQAYVNVDTRFEQVQQAQVKGHLVSVFPFIGVIFGLIGL